MKAIILVGGQGTRMRPLTLDLPKPLLPIANIAFITRQLLWLKQYGIYDVVLSLCYLPDQFVEYFDKNPIENMKISYIVEDSPLGTGGAIKYSAGEIQDSVIVCNGDVLTEIDLQELIDLHNSKNSLATIALTKVEDPSAFGVVPTNADRQVVAFVEKPSKQNAPSHWINAGIYVLSKDFLDIIPEGIQVSIERETFPKAILQGSLYALESDEYWLDVGTVDKYIQAHTYILNKLSSTSNNETYREVSNNIFSDGAVDLGKDVVVLSKCLLGDGTKIGDNTILDNVTIGKNVEVSKNVKIINSVIYDGAVINSDVNIYDSIIGNNALISEGVSLSELCVIGSNEKLAPGESLVAKRVPSNE